MPAHEYWTGKRVLVTGGAGFIGSHLADHLMARGALVTIVDNLSKGKIVHVQDVFARHGFPIIGAVQEGELRAGPHRFLLRDLTDPGQTAEALTGQDVVFHLAATIGGRGFIETHPAECCKNFAINQIVLEQSYLAGVRYVCYSSTACVYPISFQARYGSDYLLKEEDALRDGWANCDGEYGWSKLMGEVILRAYIKEHGLEGSICRYVTAYGPRENDTHAIIALIKRAVERRDPYLIWGSGEQERDFTYVDDIVEGTIRAAEVIRDGTAVNLGTAARYRIKDVAAMIFEILEWWPKEIRYDASKPEGVRSRALDIGLARRLLGWEPKVGLREGLKRTLDWYVSVSPDFAEDVE